MSGGSGQHQHTHGGRPTQPAPAWNHLQVPLFSRQPQNAHMSSDRPMAHSPHTWHTPTPLEHQQALKPNPNPYRHTPTPPDSQKNPFRHTPPPDKEPQYRHATSPLEQVMKTHPFRHTPTPPDKETAYRTNLLEHQQALKGNLYRHTPTPPDKDGNYRTPPLEHQQSLKGFRHTSTPPDKDGNYRTPPLEHQPSLKSFRHTSTPPDKDGNYRTPPLEHQQSLKGFRHTPTPPDKDLRIAQLEMQKGNPFGQLERGGGPLYRRTPPPEGVNNLHSSLMNLQMMMTSDTWGMQGQQRTPTDALRDNFMSRPDSMAMSRHSPGVMLGSMDLSVSRSPRNGSQNGEQGSSGAPISLSVRDASKINSLGPVEITKIHQIARGLEFAKSCSPTLNQGSNSPKSPKSNKLKVDSILERLNSGGDGVVITQLRHTVSPHSVIVSAHSIEDSNSRGSTSSLNITPVGNIPPYLPGEPVQGRVTPNQRLEPPHERNVSYQCLPGESILDKAIPKPKSVIMESVAASKDDAPPANCSNEDSNGSSSDGSRSKRRRKQLKTSKVSNDENVEEACKDKLEENKPEDTNHTNEVSRVQGSPTKVTSHLEQDNSNIKMLTENGMPPDIKGVSSEVGVAVVSKARRKTCSESETIDNIAAMIAETNSVDCFPAKVQVQDNPGKVVTSDVEKIKNDLQDMPVEAAVETAASENKIEDVGKEVNAVAKPQRRKRNSKSNSTDSNPSEKVKESGKPRKRAKRLDKSKPEEQPSFVEVENELEKMFAGLEEEGPTDNATQMLDPITGIMTDNLLNPATEAEKKTPTRKKRASRRSSEATSTGLISSDESAPKRNRKSKGSQPVEEKLDVNVVNNVASDKKHKNSLKGAGKKDKVKDLLHRDAYDSGSNASSSKSRGPYVQIRGPRDSPLSVNVINTPVQEEDTDKTVTKVKGNKPKSALNSDSDFRNKVKSKGLHSSTLSMKYDATTTDTSWICVFCKRGPHTGSSVGTLPQGKAQQMGDLFGPYTVTANCADFNAMMSDPKDLQFKSQPKHGTFAQNRQAKGQPKKMKLDPEEVKFPNTEMYLGMTESSQDSYEVWFHEDCAVWAPGLHLVGSKLVGLESAVWGCCTARCGKCALLGATVACVKRGCCKLMHVNCARAEMWNLDGENFSVHCKEHAMP